ncbi:MAG TPA: diguanylate cyclase [Ramlibacter sp.]|nr:diguanylate cyclase [Ramlibacter sp.]
MSTPESARFLLMYVVIPLWILAGFADWICHRRTNIEGTSGMKENVFHWVLLAQGAVAVIAMALLEVNALVLLLVFAVFLAHEFTTWLELHYTVPLRQVGPGEQMIHSFLELMPLVALALLAVMHWDQATSLLSESMPDFSPYLKDEPWPAQWLKYTALAVLLLNVLPLAEESWRCSRAAALRSRTPAPPAPT